MANISYDNRAVLAWGAQRLVSDHGSSAEGSNSRENRQLSDFYGVDEPSLNSFIYASAHNADTPPSGRRPAKRTVSPYIGPASRPRSLAHVRPKTLPAATFAEIADEAPAPQPKVSRSDSLRDKVRRVFSMPSGRRRFVTPSTSDAEAVFERQEQPVSAFERPPPHRSHLSHRSRRPPEPLEPSQMPLDIASVQLDTVATQRMKEMEERIQFLESEMEAERRKSARQQMRISELEEQVRLKEEALPALNSIISTTLKHFDAKEEALKMTIAQMRQNFTAALEEKNEALHLYDGYDDEPRSTPRSSTPGSTVSESESLRRVQSLDTHRRNMSPRSFFTSTEFDR